MTDEEKETIRKYVKSGECSFVDAVSDASMRWINFLKGENVGRHRGRMCK